MIKWCKSCEQSGHSVGSRRPIHLSGEIALMYLLTPSCWNLMPKWNSRRFWATTELISSCDPAAFKDMCPFNFRAKKMWHEVIAQNTDPHIYFLRELGMSFMKPMRRFTTSIFPILSLLSHLGQMSQNESPVIFN